MNRNAVLREIAGASFIGAVAAGFAEVARAEGCTNGQAICDLFPSGYGINVLFASGAIVLTSSLRTLAIRAKLGSSEPGVLNAVTLVNAVSGLVLVAFLLILGMVSAGF